VLPSIVKAAGYMAIDVASVCQTANDSQGAQTLAIVLSVMFSLYTIVTIALSALTIYSTSQSVEPPSLAPTVAGGQLVNTRTTSVSSIGAPSLVGLRAS
jgi:hypothetical protein